MRYRYLDDFRRGISVFAIFSYGIAVLGTPQCPPLPGNVPNNYYFGGFEFDLHKALDFAFRLRNEKNISFFPRLAPRPFFNTNHEFKYFH